MDGETEGHSMAFLNAFRTQNQEGETVMTAKMEILAMNRLEQ